MKPQQPEPPAAVIIGVLAWKNPERLARCLRSILATLPPDEVCRVEVWNNAPDSVGPQPEGVGVYNVNEQTRGEFTAALRAFLTHARARGAACAIWCNDDLEFEPGCLSAMVAECRNNPRAAIVAPMQVAMHNPGIIICGGTGRAYPAGEHKTGQRGQVWRERRTVRWMPFAATAFNLAGAPSPVDDIGLPDGNLRLWFSDSDYCIRARLAGYEVVYLGEAAVVRHEQNASINAERKAAEASAAPDPLRDRWVLDQATFARKWGGQQLEEYSS